MGFVVDKVTLGQVFSEYLGFPCQLSCHRMLYIHHLPSGAGTIDQLVAGVPSGLSLTPPQETKKVYIGVPSSDFERHNGYPDLRTLVGILWFLHPNAEHLYI
jgi:hypothetical protein